MLLIVVEVVVMMILKIIFCKQSLTADAAINTIKNFRSKGDYYDSQFSVPHMARSAALQFRGNVPEMLFTRFE